MVRYVKDGQHQSTFGKRFKPFKSHHTAAAFLATLDPKQFSQIRNMASHFGGAINHLSDTLPKHLKKKIKPSSWNFLANARSPHEVGMALVAEMRGHDHPYSESHMGGGILDGLTAATKYYYNYMIDPPYDWVKDKLGYSDIKTKLTQMDKWNADTIGQSYKDKGKRDPQLHNGWSLLPQYEGEYTSVYKEPATGNLHVAVRGSKTAEDWTYHDALIAGRNKPGDEETENIQEFLVQVAKDNPNAGLTVNSHSLSGSFVQNAFVSADPTEDAWLDHYDRINMYNPGANAFAPMEDIKQFVEDNRVHLFLNQTDPISAAYAQAVDDRSKDRVIWGNGTYYPVGAHGYAQWQGDVNYEVDDLGENIPNPSPDDDIWIDLAEQHTPTTDQLIEQYTVN